MLTIAGSDSGGGAGIQADLRTFHAFNVYGCSAITAVTAQNPNEVRRVDVLPCEAVSAQVESVLAEFPVRFVKTGMLATGKTVEVVAKITLEHSLELVVDPVMVSTSGVRLLEDSSISVMCEHLLPLAKWITPNIPEAGLICGVKLETASDLADAALHLHRKYGCNVIIKCGHLPNLKIASDVVCFQGKLYCLSSPFVKVAGNTAHGTGCTLSSAVAANLAAGRSWQETVVASKAFVYGSILEKVRLNDNLFQMYPPSEGYTSQVTLEEY